MLTKEDAIRGTFFHENHAPNAEKIRLWRRNGKTQTWKSRPNDFRVPVKHGLYDYAQIREFDAVAYHTEENCPDRKLV